MSTLLEDSEWLSDPKLEPEIPTATNQIYKYIDSKTPVADGRNANRCSSAAGCVRKRWYQNHGYIGQKIQPRARVNFMLGDLSELVVVHFIKSALVGPGKLYQKVNFGEVTGTFKVNGFDIETHSQKDLHLELGGLTIVGHSDGFGKRSSDGKWELIEVKSSSDFGFDVFKSDGPEDYLKQSHALMMTRELRSVPVDYVRFFYLKKQTGNLWDRLFQFDDETAEITRKEFLLAASDTIPDAPYGFIDEMVRRKKTGRKTVPWQCQYCPYTRECKGDFTIEFSGGKPKYIFNSEDTKLEEQCVLT